MKKKATICMVISSILFFIQYSLGAQPILIMGEDCKMESATYPVKHVLSNSQGHYFTTFNVIGTGICKFNTDMKLEFQKELKTDKKGMKTVEIFGAGNNVYLLANKKVTKGDTHYDYYLYTIDNEGEYTDEKMLFEYKSSSGIFPATYVRHSPDSSKIAIVTFQDNDSEKLKFNLKIIVIDKNGNEVYTVDHHYKNNQKALGFLQFAVDNQGVVYAHTIDFSDEKKYINHITRFSGAEAENITEIRPDFGTSFVLDAKLLTTKDGMCYFIGSYSESKDWMGSGFFFMAYSNDGKVTQPLKLTQMSKEMLSKLDQMDVLYKKKDKVGFNENVGPRKLFETKNNEIAAHFENASIKGLGWTIGNTEVSIVSKEDIICTFSKKGDITSFYVAPKNQNCDYDRFAHRCFDMSTSAMTGITNDHHDNVGNPKSLKKYTSSGGTKVSYFDKKGTFIQNHISDNKEIKDYNLITESVTQIGDHKLLFVLINNSYTKPKAKLVIMDSSHL